MKLSIIMLLLQLYGEFKSDMLDLVMMINKSRGSAMVQ